MSQLGGIAEKYNVAVILIGHMNKASGGAALYRGLGSIDLAGAARSVLAVGTLDKGDGEKYHKAIAHIKSNLAAQGDAVLFDLDPSRGFLWCGTDHNLTENDVLNHNCGTYERSGGEATREAEEFLTEILANGRVASKEIERQAQERDISIATLNRAKKSLGVKSEKECKEWHWLIPDKPSKEKNEVYHKPHTENVDNLDNVDKLKPLNIVFANEDYQVYQVYQDYQDFKCVNHDNLDDSEGWIDL